MNILPAVASMLIQFLLKRVVVHKDDTDFWLIKKDFIERIAKILPDGSLSPASLAFIDASFNALIVLMRSGGELNNIRLHLEGGDWGNAYSSAKYAVEKAFNGKAE
jgi:hypothetical protein